MFGEGNTLPQLQQKFFSYHQGQSEDLLSCSLELVELFNSSARLDTSFDAVRTKTLKGRLAEAVRDEGLKRELRRLIIDSPDLTFFEARDRAIEWLGNCQEKPQRNVNVQEVKAADDAGVLKSLLIKQGEQLQKQQKQIDTLLQAMTQQPAQRWSQGPRRCFNCGSAGHLKRGCPHVPSSSAGMYSPSGGGPSHAPNFGNIQPHQVAPRQFTPQQSTQPQFGSQHPASKPPPPTPRQPLN